MERPCPECGGKALCESGATSHFKLGCPGGVEESPWYPVVNLTMTMAGKGEPIFKSGNIDIYIFKLGSLIFQPSPLLGTTSGLHG